MLSWRLTKHLDCAPNLLRNGPFLQHSLSIVCQDETTIHGGKESSTGGGARDMFGATEPLA